MAESVNAAKQPLAEAEVRLADVRPKGDKLAAGSIMGAHSLQHAYQTGFYIILVEIYAALGLTPVSAGLLATVRQVTAGLATMAGGLMIDRFQHKRIQVLYLSLIAMGVGYLLVGLAPTFLIILAAAGLAGAAGSLWHPAALSLLSQRYPEQRGLMISLHRSAGSVGDTVGPVLIGAALLALTWRGVLYAVLPLALLTLAVLWLILRKSSNWQALQVKPKERSRPLTEQLRNLGALFRTRSLVLLIMVSALAGLGQGGLLVWLSLYLSQELGMPTFLVGIHVAMLTGIGIFTGPWLGGLSDRIGRKPVIIGVLGAQAAIVGSMAFAGSGILLSVLIALLGAVMFGVNSLVQASALDLAHGRKLEGTMIGLLWGSNAVFVGGAPLFLGLAIQSLGFTILFPYIAAMNFVAMSSAFALPALNRPAKVTVQS